RPHQEPRGRPAPLADGRRGAHRVPWRPGRLPCRRREVGPARHGGVARGAGAGAPGRSVDRARDRAGGGPPRRGRPPPPPPRPRGGRAVRNVFTRTGIWTTLQRGTWVEFGGREAPQQRARLTWISPNKGVYLFTNPLSTKGAVSISPEALAEQMRLGEARVLD